MMLNAMERMFVERWKSIDFTNWNEADVREEFVAPLLRILGYAKDTTAGVLRERSVPLAEPYHRVGRDRIKLDYQPTIRLRGFWIIEAKAGTPRELSFGDVLQAHLYAIHPEVAAQLIVLTNGWSVRLYDALTLRSWDDVVLDVRQAAAEDGLPELKKYLAAQSLLANQRARILAAAADTLRVEVDVAEVDRFARETARIASNLRRVVERNAREVEISAFRESESRERSELQDLDLDLLMRVRMDIPTDARLAPAHELVRRAVAADGDGRQRIVDTVSMLYRGRPHAIFRVQAVFALVRMLAEGVEVKESAYVHGLPAAIDELASANAEYWAWNDLSNALCHLDNTTLRIAYKLGTRLLMDRTAGVVRQLVQAMSAEERLRERPTVAKYMVGTVGLVAEFLWRQFAGASTADEAWNGIWALELLEQHVDKLPRRPYPDGDSDLLFFEHYGRGFDMLRVGTWDALRRGGGDVGKLGLSERVRLFAGMQRDAVMASIPTGKKPPPGWTPDPAWSPGRFGIQPE